MVREIAFSELTRCLPDQCVDVLWTNSSVRHVAVESHPAQAGTELIGVVAARHRLADAGSIDVEQFCEEPMLTVPLSPRSGWPRSGWPTCDQSTRRGWRVEVDAQDQADVLRKVAGGDAVITSVAMMRPLLGPQLRAVTLLGGPRMGFYAARRSDDPSWCRPGAAQRFSGGAARRPRLRPPAAASCGSAGGFAVRRGAGRRRPHGPAFRRPRRRNGLPSIHCDRRVNACVRSGNSPGASSLTRETLWLARCETLPRTRDEAR